MTAVSSSHHEHAQKRTKNLDNFIIFNICGVF